MTQFRIFAVPFILLFGCGIIGYYAMTHTNHLIPGMVLKRSITSPAIHVPIAQAEDPVVDANPNAFRN